MKNICFIVCCATMLLMPLSVSAATVTCEVKSVGGSTMVLTNCSKKRVQDFKKGDRVKVKLDKKKN